ncbi:MAG: cysteine hydrolase family protein [Ilumatobacteraceae bacterium]
MSTLIGRPHSALVVIDVQNGVVGNAHDRDGVVSRIAALVERARSQAVPVIWVQHSDGDLAKGSHEWRIIAELQPRPDEPVVHKSYNDSFEETTLESELAERAVSRLVVAGAQTEWCIRSTLHGAIARGYDAVLVSDAHTTEDMSEAIPATAVIEMTNRYWMWHSAPGRAAGVETAAAVALAG